MKKCMRVSALGMVATLALLSACTSIGRHEQVRVYQLKEKGVTMKNPLGYYEKPVEPLLAGGLNILPGFGNFYLASAGDEPMHYAYGVLNLLFWPLSCLWAIPDGFISGENINKREFVQYYFYTDEGKKALREAGIVLDDSPRY